MYQENLYWSLFKQYEYYADRLADGIVFEGAKFRNNASKSLKACQLKSKLGAHKFSKSTSELHDDEDEIRMRFSEYQGPSLRSDINSLPLDENNTTSIHPESSISHLSVLQKTQAFLFSLKDKWVKNRSREKHGGKHKELDDKQRRRRPLVQQPSRSAEFYLADESPPTSCNRRKTVRTHHNYSGCSTDYAADNSSDHSSSVTPSKRATCSQHQIVTSADVEDSSNFQDCNNGKDGAADAYGQQDDRHLTVFSTPVCSTELPLFDHQIEEAKQNREAAFRKYSFFQLKVHLKCGENLIARDKSGTSDPYVKFKVSGKLLYKSKIIYRDLNPIWDECFTLPIDDPFIPIHIKVFDYDWGLQDDFMGAAFLDLTTLDFGKPTDLVLSLEDARSKEYLGEIKLNVTLWPRTQEDKEQYYQKSIRSESSRRLKSQIWSSVVTIVLIKGTNLLPMDVNGYSDPYVKFRLGNEKYKSKVIYRTLNPKWLEQFDLHMYDDQSQELEITVWDKDRTKDDFMGKCTVSLSKFDREVTHKIVQDLEDGAGTISLLLTISGTTSSETITDLTAYEENPVDKTLIQERYALLRTFNNLRDVGHLTVKVYKAQGLAAADLGGKSDPFCVLELVNSRLQTQTEYKTLTPCWNKIFTFNVKDINSVLEITVYDEDKDHKVEFLGKVAIPLLKIRNNEKRWYALKDKKLRCRAKGNSPQILLEMNVIWNTLRACWRTINPKEDKYMQSETKFKRQVFVRNVMRLKNMIMYFVTIGKFIQGCFEWESPIQSTLALITFILACHYTEPYMIPIALLVIFFKCYLVQILTSSTLGWNAPEDEDEYPDDDDEDDDKDKSWGYYLPLLPPLLAEWPWTETVDLLFKLPSRHDNEGGRVKISGFIMDSCTELLLNEENEEKKSIKERLQAIQEVTQTVQNIIGYIASLCESVKNTFNFTVPFLSYLSVVMLITITVILYWVPIRYLIMFWGINKFSRKLFRPHTIPNNEFLDLLSRVPDDEDLIMYREIKPQPTLDTPTGRNLRKKHKVT